MEEKKNTLVETPETPSESGVMGRPEDIVRITAFLPEKSATFNNAAQVCNHTYYLDYQNRRKDFVLTYLEHLVNWEHADALFR